MSLPLGHLYGELVTPSRGAELERIGAAGIGGENLRQDYPERGADSYFATRTDLAAVVLNDVAADGEAQTSSLALFLRGEEGIEDAIDVVL